jgi:hypothetical protein
MDEQLTKKESILYEFKRRMGEGSMTQHDVLDLRQELERCNHIIKHMIRGQENPAGRWATSAFFGIASYLTWKSFFVPKRRDKKYLLIQVVTFLPSVLIASMIGYGLGAWRFGNTKDARRFNQMFNNSLATDNEFYSIANNLQYENIKHI